MVLFLGLGIGVGRYHLTTVFDLLPVPGGPLDQPFWFSLVWLRSVRFRLASLFLISVLSSVMYFLHTTAQITYFPLALLAEINSALSFQDAPEKTFFKVLKGELSSFSSTATQILYEELLSLLKWSLRF